MDIGTRVVAVNSDTGMVGKVSRVAACDCPDNDKGWFLVCVKWDTGEEYTVHSFSVREALS